VCLLYLIINKTQVQLEKKKGTSPQIFHFNRCDKSLRMQHILISILNSMTLKTVDCYSPFKNSRLYPPKFVTENFSFIS